ncbi:MAG: hypothetical protein RR348_01865 [Clostridia bacterium]
MKKNESVEAKLTAETSVTGACDKDEVGEETTKQKFSNEELMKLLVEMRAERKAESKKKWMWFYILLPFMAFAMIDLMFHFIYLTAVMGMV